jgi:hypothetical protein
MAKKPKRPSAKAKAKEDKAVKPLGDLPRGTTIAVGTGPDGKVTITAVPPKEPLPDDAPDDDPAEAAREARVERAGAIPPVPEVKRPKLPGAGDYTPEKAERILTRLADGEGLNEICRDEDLPAESTVRGWVIDNRDEFAAKYTRARDIGVDCRADRLKDTAASALGMDGPGVQAVRLMCEVEKWYISKIAPKKYGDRLDLNVNDQRTDTPEGRKARIAELMQLGFVPAAPADAVPSGV